MAPRVASDRILLAVALRLTSVALFALMNSVQARHNA